MKFKKYLVEAKKFKIGTKVYVKDLKEYGEITDIEKDAGEIRYYVRLEAGGTSDYFYSSELK